VFQHEGNERSHRHNQILAGYLALVAGFVNSAGFILIGSFTSHVTGNIGRMANDVALGDSSAAMFAVIMIVGFFGGAFAASVALESSLIRSRGRVYGVLLLAEAALLATFAVLSYVMETSDARFKDVQAILLCIAMGLQNSFVTRLSGAVVRTTHLTGVVTDLGIEGARWFRHWRARLGARARIRLVAGDGDVLAPQGPRTVLLLTIVGAFIAGSAIGAVSVIHAGHLVVLAPTALLVGGAAFAFKRARDLPAYPR
jgi:uncharacterized membrane protein YoaK (UPF0700 family)